MLKTAGISTNKLSTESKMKRDRFAEFQRQFINAPKQLKGCVTELRGIRTLGQEMLCVEKSVFHAGAIGEPPSEFHPISRGTNKRGRRRAKN